MVGHFKEAKPCFKGSDLDLPCVLGRKLTKDCLDFPFIRNFGSTDSAITACMVLHKTHHQEKFLNLKKDKWYGILIERMLQYPVSHFRQNLRVSLHPEAGGRETPEEKRQSFDELRKRRSDLGVNIICRNITNTASPFCGMCDSCTLVPS